MTALIRAMLLLMSSYPHLTMAVAIDSSTEDVSCLSRSLAAIGLGSGGRLRRARSAASSEKTNISEKRKSSLDSVAPSITSTAVEPSDSDMGEVKPWILDEELARARHKTRSTQDAVYIKIRYGTNETEWRVYPTTRIARLKVGVH